MQKQQWKKSLLGDAESKSGPDGKKVSTGIGREWKSSPSGNWKGFKVIRTGNYNDVDSKGVVSLEKMGKWIALPEVVHFFWYLF